MGIGPDHVTVATALGEQAPPPEAAPGSGTTAVRGRSLWQIAWGRLRRDRVAMAGGFTVVFLILVALFAPLIVKS